MGGVCELEKIENCGEFSCQHVKYNGGGLVLKLRVRGFGGNEGLRLGGENNDRWIRLLRVMELSKVL